MKIHFYICSCFLFQNITMNISTPREETLAVFLLFKWEIKVVINVTQCDVCDM